MRRLLTYLGPYQMQVVLAVAAIIAHSHTELAPPYLTKLVIDEYIPARSVVALNRRGVVSADARRLVCIRVSADVNDADDRATDHVRSRVQILNRLQQLDVRFYDRNPVGRLMTRVTTDVDALNELFTSGVVAVFGDAFTLVGIMAALVWMDWRLALVAFSVLPLIVVITQWFRVNVRDSYRTVRLWIARINAFLQERITAWQPCICSGARRAISPPSTASTGAIVTQTSGRFSSMRSSIQPLSS